MEIEDPSAYIFSVSESKKFLLQDNKAKEAINAHTSWGPSFGKANSDIFVAGDFVSENSFTNFGNSYQLPEGMDLEAENTKSYLAGSYKFTVAELEVFQLQD